MMSCQEKIALVIGIDQYHVKNSKNLTLEQLPSSKKDAEDMARLLSSRGFTLYTGKPIIGSKLDPEYGYTAVQNAIRDFFRKTTRNQLLLFYFSGHGVPELRGGTREIHLATPQVNPDDPLNQGVPLSLLTLLVNTCISKRVVCMIDSCYSGAAASLVDSRYMPMGDRDEEKGENMSKTVLQASREIVNQQLKEQGKYFLLSTDPFTSSYALRNDPNSNSIYTKHLLKGLEGVEPQNDEPGSINLHGWITPESLHEYVSLQVRKEVPFQNPIIQGSQYGANPTILVEYSLRSPLTTQTSPDFDDLRRMIEILNDHYNKLYALDAITDVLEFWDTEGKGNLLKCLRRVQSSGNIISLSDKDRAQINEWLEGIHSSLTALRDARKNRDYRLASELEAKLRIQYGAAVVFLSSQISQVIHKGKGKTSKLEADVVNKKVDTILKFYAVIDFILYLRDGVNHCMDAAPNTLSAVAHPYRNPINNFRAEFDEWLKDIQQIPEIQKNSETKTKMEEIYKDLYLNIGLVCNYFFNIKTSSGTVSTSMDNTIKDIRDLWKLTISSVLEEPRSVPV